MDLYKISVPVYQIETCENIPSRYFLMKRSIEIVDPYFFALRMDVLPALVIEESRLP